MLRIDSRQSPVWVAAALAFLVVDEPTWATDAHFADQVVSVSLGSGRTHPNFDDPESVVGPSDYSGGPFGVGAYSLGAGGEIVVRMAAAFRGSGTSASDLVITEIGPSNGATAEVTSVEVSPNGEQWFNVGHANGGTAEIDLDAHGFGATTSLRFVRLVDTSLIPFVPAGADIDSVKAKFFSPDFNSDGIVDAQDLAVLLGNWGQSGVGDLDDSGSVDAADLSILLGAWG